jgi:hypothetical protein
MIELKGDDDDDDDDDILILYHENRKFLNRVKHSVSKFS